jgi:redox-sensitive bicupin YhaK (pirin superfamily)
MYNKVITGIKPLGFAWETRDPFLICMHHADSYPKGNDKMGPDASLAGRNLGQDFSPSEGWRMYHGESVPGFPRHPHRGFETVTVVLRGIVDHSDSSSAAGRYANGDVQWMTAGSGLQHAEMFPLIRKNKTNPLELFQIWLNLPRSKKMVDPYYKMLWAEDIPRVEIPDNHGRKNEIILIAGRFGEHAAIDPAPDSWAADSQNDVAIWIIKLTAGTTWKLPAATQPLSRTLYFYEGSSITAAGSVVSSNMAIDLLADQELILENGEKDASLLLLQGQPIGDPVAQYGPFVMNTQAEIQQAYSDYQRTQFGGWPWDRNDPVHSGSSGRFARYIDGNQETKGTVADLMT